MKTHVRPRIATWYLPLAMLFAACTSAPQAQQMSTTSASVTIAPAAPPLTGSSGTASLGAMPNGDIDRCEQAEDNIKAATSMLVGVTGQVRVDGCRLATVMTTLAPTEKDSATAVCQNAAAEAHSHGVARVNIVGQDGSELATGTDSSNCAQSPS